MDTVFSPITVYLGAAIDHSTKSKEEFDCLVKLVYESLDSKVVLYNPMAAFKGSGVKDRSLLTNKYIYRINNLALQLSHIAVFYWSGVPSFGMPLEIYSKSRRQGRFIVWNASGMRAGVYLEHTVASSPYGVLVENGTDFRNELASQYKDIMSIS